ncbi:MAG TPA: hypothetical protein VMQ93_01185 [Novosphingobium sp.]|nr:hypothetical protein [Novosphingobium sp.]
MVEQQNIIIERLGILEPLQAPRHFMPPSARELRSQAVYRLQIGLFGLCAMLLIVGLANIIRDRLRLSETVDPIQEVVAVDAKPTKPASDPLADIGVVPAADPSPTPAPAAVPNAEASGDTAAPPAP